MPSVPHLLGIDFQQERPAMSHADLKHGFLVDRKVGMLPSSLCPSLCRSALNFVL